MTCHAAIVARELGVPCVVGTRDATSRLHNGQLVTVDGSAARVTAVAGTAHVTAAASPAIPSPIAWEALGTRLYVNLATWRTRRPRRLSCPWTEFTPRPVIYRATDFRSNEFRNLAGGAAQEPQEQNPMIGYRGYYRVRSRLQPVPG